ncbi:MAG: hypothetical protein Q9224_001842 [Gallowayella concinna]
MSKSTGRVSETTFKIAIGVFFGFAIVAAIARVAIRLWLRMRLRLDDYLLLCSTACLVAATGLLYYGTPVIFLSAKLTFDPSAVFESGINQNDLLHDVNLIPKINWAYLALSWATIFLIKFGFLSLFRQLVDRVPPVYKFWKGTLIVTVLVGAFTICDGFVACPKQGSDAGRRAVECSATPEVLNKALAVGITAITLDMLTDVLILTIPIWLLWRVQISRKQKLGLAGFLCLSVCMIVMAIARVSGIHYRGKFDNTWIFMWQQIEACVAVTMLSLTAFRSIFVASRPIVNNNKASPWIPSTRRLFRNYKKSKEGEHQRLDNLSIPSATITGLSCFEHPDSTALSIKDVSFPSSLDHIYEASSTV